MLTVEKIVTPEACLERVRQWQSQGNKVVFTNGCFDIIHLGHVDYLEKARQRGDKLVVGINSDESVTRLKGEGRPVIPENSRLRLIAAFAFVDAVVCFREDTPEPLIERLLPDVLVKGSDYTISNIVGASIVLQNGGKVETIALTYGFSTSSIIQKIKTQN